MVFSTLVLAWIVLVLFVYMLVFRLYHALRGRYRAGRAALYEPAVELALLEEPLDRVVSAFRPRRLGDAGVVQEVLLAAMQHLKGAPFETLRQVAFRLGLIERNLRALKSRDRHARGNAMEALGVMRAPQGIVGILDVLRLESLDLQLVALRALAAIGDPAVLPYVLEAAGGLPPPLLPRAASLLLEFGPPGRKAVAELVNRHAASFPPRVLRETLQQLAEEAGDAVP